MKDSKRFLFIAVVILSICAPAYTWIEETTHPQLTKKAIADSNQSVLDEYIKQQLGIPQGLNGILLLDQSTVPEPNRIPSDQFEDRILSVVPVNPTVMDLLKAGSELEDIPDPRAKHHFHDPYRDAGLENKTEHPWWAEFFETITGGEFDLRGTANLRRALGTEEQEWKDEYENYFAWPDARDYLYKALTEASGPTREHYLALTFLSFGHVLHLMEDMGIPAHARNDFVYAHLGTGPNVKIHLPPPVIDIKKNFGNPLEKWAEKEIINNGGNIPSGWFPPGWTPNAKVFSKLSNYWDTGVYDANTQPYIAPSDPSLDAWGLSERTNYQFLSKSTIFKENDGTLYYFPHPDVSNVTGYIKPDVYFYNSVPVDYKYISGYDITHLARTKYTQKYAYMGGMLYPVAWAAYHTTFDDAVYEDYAKETIPRTIDYTTGLANYFFRGSIEVSIGCPQGCNPGTGTATYSMIITNTSMNTDREQVLKGGAFEFYWEDLSGNRTQANDFTVYTYDPCDPNTTQLWDQDSILPYGEHIDANATFDVLSCTDINDYVVVYKGAINDFEYPDDTDSDDTQALACWTKSESFSVPATSYTLLVTEWGGTDEYSECAEYLKFIFDKPENSDGYTLAKTPNSSCFDCRWFERDYHTCFWDSPYCPLSCNVTQIMILYSSSPDEFCVVITPFLVTFCGYPLFVPFVWCDNSYKRCFYRQPGESYDDFWERIFNGGVFGDGSEIDCTEDGCKIFALDAWTDSWVRVLWIPNP